MNYAYLLQQVIAYANLALPMVIAYHFFPHHVLRPYGIAFFALFIGTFVAFKHYQQAAQVEKILKYAPTGEHREKINAEIVKCGLSPEDVQLRYGYTNDQVATTSLSTLTIDPMVWQGVAEDKDAIAIKDIIDRQILPHATDIQKEMHTHIKDTLTKDAQTFILHHELGHIYNNSSLRIIAGFFCTSAVSTAIAMSASASVIAPYGGLAALALGMIVGYVSDHSTTLMSNAFVKYSEEEKADAFAMKHSSSEEIKAAAEFFATYDIGAQKVRNNGGLLYAYLPISATTAHPDAITRVAYLEKASKEKSSA